MQLAAIGATGPRRLLNAAGDQRNNNPLVGRRQETRLAMNRIVAAAPEICLTTSRAEHQRTSHKLRPGSPGTGEGRIYTITVQYQDASGYTSIKTTTVLKKKPRRIPPSWPRAAYRAVIRFRQGYSAINRPPLQKMRKASLSDWPP